MPILAGKLHPHLKKSYVELWETYDQAAQLLWVAQLETANQPFLD